MTENLKVLMQIVNIFQKNKMCCIVSHCVVKLLLSSLQKNTQLLVYLKKNN